METLAYLVPISFVLALSALTQVISLIKEVELLKEAIKSIKES